MEYIFTERAHFMCPNMCFGIVICINRELNESRIADAVKCLSLAHPFIRALISHDEKENRFFYDVKETSQAELSICPGNVLNIDSPEIIAVPSRKLLTLDFTALFSLLNFLFTSSFCNICLFCPPG